MSRRSVRQGTGDMWISRNVRQIVKTAFQEMFIFYLYTSVMFEFYLVYVSVIRKKD